MSAVKSKRGGARNGAGVKPMYIKALRPVTVYMTDDHKAVYQSIGGGQAVRNWLEQEGGLSLAYIPNQSND